MDSETCAFCIIWWTHHMIQAKSGGQKPRWDPRLAQAKFGGHQNCPFGQFCQLMLKFFDWNAGYIFVSRKIITHLFTNFMSSASKKLVGTCDKRSFLIHSLIMLFFVFFIIAIVSTLRLNNILDLADVPWSFLNWVIDLVVKLVFLILEHRLITPILLNL